MDKHAAQQKKKNLIGFLKNLDSLMVAFSGGVDSTFLLALSHEILGEKVMAATADSRTYPSRERDEAIRFTKEKGIRHIIFKSDELRIPEFASNHPDRCYHCKKALIQTLKTMAYENGIQHIAFAANMDDLNDYRPGMQAEKETGIMSPLIDVQLTKDEIRFLSKEMGLPTWDKPAMACLASRIPYHTPITLEKLDMVSQAEVFLAEKGFKQYRVRHHDSVARIEVDPPYISRFMEKDFRKMIVQKFREIGFKYISLDMEGYVSGNMNRVLKKEDDYES